MKRYVKNIICVILIVSMLGLLCFTINKGMNNDNQPNMKESLDNGMESPEKNDSKMEEPPEKPDGSEMEEPPEKPDESNDSKMPSQNGNKQNISVKYYVIVGITSILISIILSYLIISNFNKKSFKETFMNKDKIIIYVLFTIIVTSLLIGLSYIALNQKTTLNDPNNMNSNNMNSNNNDYKATLEIKESKTIENDDYDNVTADENTILVSGDINVNITNVDITKSGDSSGGDNTSFYGTNSAIIAKDKAILNIDNVTINTNGTGANGVFSYGGSASTNNTSSDGTSINISNSTITTNKDNSGGIMTTGGGITNASNLNIITYGISSAAIRSDRGGGTVNVDGGTYETNGKGSPSIYSTANITVKNAKLISNTSEGIVIEGKNSVTIENTELVDNNVELNGQSTTYKNIFLYQSMSGDAAEGSSTFTSNNSKITTNNGDTFYVTNTNAIINLNNNEIINNDENGNLLRVQADSWGKEGSNGGSVSFNLENQDVEGNIVVDEISSLEFNLKNSNYEGIINSNNEGKITLTIDETSTLKLMGDCYINELINEDSSNNNIDYNGYKLYVNGTAIN